MCSKVCTRLSKSPLCRHMKLSWVSKGNLLLRMNTHLCFLIKFDDISTLFVAFPFISEYIFILMLIIQCPKMANWV